MSYASDADACVVYESLADGAAADALAVVATVQAKLNQPAQDPPFELDLDLRPEGKNGPIARTIESYQAYYERWSLTWESQALLRARAVAGDGELGEKFIQIIDALRFPEHGLEESEVREIRRIKARVESERLPRGADPQLHVKLGPGGISDVEWCVQLLQLQHAHECSGLRTPSTLEALEAIEAAKLLSAEDVAVLREAWILASELRNGMMLTHGRASDSLPVALDHARLLAFVRGRTTMSGLIDTYRRGARRARRIMENVVYGVETSIP
jgi:glutamate-ammonia-ligase adenylyltransferase